MSLQGHIPRDYMLERHQTTQKTKKTHLLSGVSTKRPLSTKGLATLGTSGRAKRRDMLLNIQTKKDSTKNSKSTENNNSVKNSPNKSQPKSIEFDFEAIECSMGKKELQETKKRNISSEKISESRQLEDINNEKLGETKISVTKSPNVRVVAMDELTKSVYKRQKIDRFSERMLELGLSEFGKQYLFDIIISFL